MADNIIEISSIISQIDSAGRVEANPSLSVTTSYNGVRYTVLQSKKDLLCENPNNLCVPHLDSRQGKTQYHQV